MLAAAWSLLSKMFVMSFVLVSSIIFVLNVTGQLPQYHQNDYDVKLDRVEIKWYNRSYGRDVNLNFVWYNRTYKVVNGSAYLLKDLSRNVTGSVQFYKFMSNEYRFFPITVGSNLCSMYDLNNLNVREALKGISNVHSCPAKKGFYYVYNAVIDFSKFPPYIPRGQYKAVGQLYHKSDYLGEAHGYGTVMDKPMKWMK